LKLLFVHLDTDHIFHELFRDHPEWLRELTELPLPVGCRGSSHTLKQLELRCDLLLEPVNPDDPCYLVEFQLYHDHSIFNRIELARQLLWKHLNPKPYCRRRDFRPREIETVILFGSRSELPSSHERYPLTRILFIDELLEALAGKHPDSPLVAALAPLRSSLSELEKTAEGLYDRISFCADLPPGDREVLGEIFQNLLLQRFQSKTREEILQMIAELTPLHKTHAGKELLEEGIEKGIEQGASKLVHRMISKGKSIFEIAELTDLPEEEISRLLEVGEE